MACLRIRTAFRTCRSRWATARLLWCLAASVVPGWPSLAQAATITYVYDELGRLVGVVDPGGDTAVYRYDAVGNLLSITRYASSTVSIIDFTPKQGPVNTTVTISGTGFSPTPSQNIVTFNGVTATVTSSTATQIVTRVPAGATTGRIGVTAPGGSATSSEDFVVGPVTGPPTITSFTPTVGTPGTTVTITGTNYDPTPANDTVTFNAVRLAAVSAATATQITTAVPSGVGSGRITVTTPNGSVTSGGSSGGGGGDFFIPPAPHVVADVQVTGRMAYGSGSTTITLASGKIALLVFDGAAGQGMVLSMSSITISPYSAVWIYYPDGSYLTHYDYVAPPATSITVASLPVTGTYTVMVDPGTNSGSMTLSIVAPDLTVVTGSIVVPASPVSPAKDGSYSFPVGWTVKNNGPSTATPNPSWADTAYLSSDTTLNLGQGQDLALVSQVHTDPVAPGGTYQVSSATAAIYPGQAPGEYWILVKTDSNNVLTEASERNNVGVSATKVTLLGLPDLVVTNVTPTATQICRNQDGTRSVPLNWTVQNVGPSTAIASWGDDVRLRPVGGGADVGQGGGEFHNTDLGPGATYMVSKTAGLYGTIPSGNYYVVVETDAGGSMVAEANETNNIGVSTIVVTLTDDLCPP